MVHSSNWNIHHSASEIRQQQQRQQRTKTSNAQRRPQKKMSQHVPRPGTAKRGPKKKSAAYGSEAVATSVFASVDVAERMRRQTWQRDGTDEPKLDPVPGSVCLIPIIVRASVSNPAKGLAAFASRALGKDEFIGEYAGEVVDLRSKDNRTAT